MSILVKAKKRGPGIGGRKPGPVMPCGWGCGSVLLASEIRDHWRECRNRPKDDDAGDVPIELALAFGREYVLDTPGIPEWVVLQPMGLPGGKGWLLTELFVYLAGSEDRTIMKIGCTSNLEKRMKPLREYGAKIFERSLHLKYLAVAYADHSTEWKLLSKWSRFLIFGNEWFKWDQEILDDDVWKNQPFSLDRFSGYSPLRDPFTVPGPSFLSNPFAPSS